MKETILSVPVIGVESPMRVAIRASKSASRNWRAYTCWSVTVANERWLALKNESSFRFQLRNSTEVFCRESIDGFNVSTTLMRGV